MEQSPFFCSIIFSYKERLYIILKSYAYNLETLLMLYLKKQKLIKVSFIKAKNHKKSECQILMIQLILLRTNIYKKKKNQDWMIAMKKA